MELDVGTNKGCKVYEPRPKELKQKQKTKTLVSYLKLLVLKDL
jgi:hypothetical protein